MAETIPVTPPELPDHSSGSDFVFFGHGRIAISCPQGSREDRKAVKSADKVTEVQPAPGGFCGQENCSGELFVEMNGKHP